jgi:hypothetical protein
VWVGEANTTPLSEVKPAIRKLKLATGAGIKAKKGALGSWLRTPRALAEGDVKELRSLAGAAPPVKKASPNAVYMAAVEATVTKHAPSGKLGRFRLENARVPFAGKLEHLKPFEVEQIRCVIGDEIDWRSWFGGHAGDGESSELAEMQVCDVIDTTTGKPVYQLMLWPYGDGALVEHGTTKQAAAICQHGLDPMGEVTIGWTRDIARAWLEGSKRLGLSTGHIDFSEEEAGTRYDEDDGEG